MFMKECQEHRDMMKSLNRNRRDLNESTNTFTIKDIKAEARKRAKKLYDPSSNHYVTPGQAIAIFHDLASERKYVKFFNSLDDKHPSKYVRAFESAFMDEVRKMSERYMKSQGVQPFRP